MTTLDKQLVKSIKQHEGLSLKAYKDTEGVLTIGYGHNLEDFVIPQHTADAWLDIDIQEAIDEAGKLLFIEKLGRARRNVIIEMVFNLGLPRFLKFKKMIDAVVDSDWEQAATEMLDSKWAEQVGDRAQTLANTMRTGWYG